MTKSMGQGGDDLVVRRVLALALAAVCLTLLCGCGGSLSPSGSRSAPAQGPGYTLPEGDFEPYEAPAFADAAFHEDAAEGTSGALVDLSAVNDGYVAVAASSSSRLKFQVVKDDTTYNYDIASDGTPSVFPLQCGSGTYRFRVMENVTESKYAELYTTEAAVTLADEFQPFLRPNDYVRYTENSACVRKAAELAAAVPDALGVVARVYEYICNSVTYDRNKAIAVRTGYMPDPDETMAEGSGICFDYASLAAAMLRSQGIPVKMVFGYVSPDGLYHAWNMFYTEQTGWVTVGFEVRADTWNRLDLTFAASGADDEFVGDGSNYSDLYYY